MLTGLSIHTRLSVSITRCLILFSLVLCLPKLCSAQQSPEHGQLVQQLARLDSAMTGGDTSSFAQMVSLTDLQELFAWVVKEKITTQSGKSRILSIKGNTAYVFLSGLFLYGNSGDETNLSTKYTGMYRFTFSDGSWKLDERIGIDRLNLIKRQDLDIVVKPEAGIAITDTLNIDINDQLGFAVKLNHRAKLGKVLLNGSAVDYLFSGGMLWINSKPKRNQQLIIQYAIEVEKDEENKNSSYFGSLYGHLRNQYFWHPFFSFSSPNDRAEFTLRCRIPESFQLSTSLPQTDSISQDERIIFARSESPTFGLSLYYDKNWEISTHKKNQVIVMIYATADFVPGKEVMYEQFSTNYDILRKEFGDPISNYFGIVQDRTGGNGWKNRANSVVVAGQSGSYLITDKPNPRAVFGHEVAHGWTSPTGPATNFLMEGWATYAESVLLRSAYGDSIVPLFFYSQKQNYLNGNFDGKKSLWDDYSNSGISYSKGAWLFYMLENQLGREKFSAGMRRFIGAGKQTIQSFIREMSRAADKNMESFLLSWLKSDHIPSLKVDSSKSKIEILQVGEPLPFQLEVQVMLKNGQRLNKVLDFRSSTRSLTIKEGEIESFILDPNQKLLYQLK